MGDSEIRDALTRRLAKNVSDPSPSSRGVVAPSPVNKGLPPLPRVAGLGSNGQSDAFTHNSIHLEGYLNKLSSGSFSRWQRRYFVLDNGRLSYFKKLPSDQAGPNKVFGIRKIKSITEKIKSDDREFELVFTTGKTYGIRASTPEDALKWKTSIKSAMAYCEQYGSLDQDNEDGDGSISEDAGMTSVNGSVLSEVSPKQSMFPNSPVKDPSSSSALASILSAGGHSSRRDSIQPWDTTDIDLSGLERNFEEWFYFVPEDSAGVSSIKISHVVEGCNRANNHLWSVLAGLPRNSDLKAPAEALVKAKARIAISSPEAQLKVNTLVEEYYSKLSLYVNKALDLRVSATAPPAGGSGRTPSTLGLNGLSSSPQGSSVVSMGGSLTSMDLPMLMDCVAKMINLMDKLLPVPQPHCVCGYCDPSGVNILKLQRAAGGKKAYTQPSLSCSNDKWRKSLRSLLQRVGGDVEVGLIEELQLTMQNCEHVWNLPSGSHAPSSIDASSGLIVHGPCPISHPLLEDVVLVGSSVALMTSFSTSFLQSAQTKCINAAQQWMAAYPQCARLIAEHSSSSLVAVINSLWRQFKRRSCLISEAADTETERKYSDSIRANRETLFVNGGNELSDLEHLIAFANEAVLVSRFCAKTWSNGVSSKFLPDVFVTCMEGLSVGYLTTAAEASQSIVKIHFYPRVRYDLGKMFVSKNLLITSPTPMQYCKTMLKQLSMAVDTRYGLPCVSDALIGLSAQAIVKAYLPALIKAKPRTKTFKTLNEFLESECQIYRDMFAKDFPIPQTMVDENTALFKLVIQILNETDKINLSVQFNIATKLVAGNSTYSFIIMNGILKMREHEFYNEKKQISQLLASMKETIQASNNRLSQENELVDDNSPTSSYVRHNHGITKSTIIVLGTGHFKHPWKFEE